MDTTASSFTLRKNAKRAAEAMIRKGIAPAVDYGIKLSDDGRFEIVWKTAETAPIKFQHKSRRHQPRNDTGSIHAISWTVRQKGACVSSSSIGETDGHHRF